jgi:hypothetical protein
MESEQNVEETVKSLGVDITDKENMSEEEKLRLEEVKALVEAESLDPTTSMNIIINAVQVTFDSDMYNDLDRYLIAKSLNCFKSYVDKGEDIVLKVS